MRTAADLGNARRGAESGPGEGATTASLALVDFHTQDPAESLALAPSAPYYLSFVFDSLDKPAESLRMLRDRVAALSQPVEGGGGNPPCRAGTSSRRATTRPSRWPGASASSVSRRGAGRGPGASSSRPCTGPSRTRPCSRRRNGSRAPDAEVLLFRAVSSLRLELPPGAGPHRSSSFSSERVSSLHGRVYTFIAARARLPAALRRAGPGPAGREERPRPGRLGPRHPPAGGSAPASIDPALVADGALVADLGNSYVSAGRAAAGARVHGEARRPAHGARRGPTRRSRRDGCIAGHGTTPAPFRGCERRADASSPRHSATVRAGSSWTSSSPSTRTDLPARRSARGGRLVGAIPSYFSDLLHSRIAELVAARKWRTLVGLWRALDAAGPADVRAQLSYLLAREMAGRGDPAASGRPARGAGGTVTSP